MYFVLLFFLCSFVASTVDVASEDSSAITGVEREDPLFGNSADSETIQDAPDALRLTGPAQNLIEYAVTSDDSESSSVVADASGDCPQNRRRHPRGIRERSASSSCPAARQDIIDPLPLKEPQAPTGQNTKPTTGTGGTGDANGNNKLSIPNKTPTILPYVEPGELNISPSFLSLKLKRLCPPGDFKHLICSSGKDIDEFCDYTPTPMCALNNCQHRESARDWDCILNVRNCHQKKKKIWPLSIIVRWVGEFLQCISPRKLYCCRDIWEMESQPSPEIQVGSSRHHGCMFCKGWRNIRPGSRCTELFASVSLDLMPMTLSISISTVTRMTTVAIDLCSTAHAKHANLGG